MWERSTEEFLATLRSAGLRRGFVVGGEDGRPRASHPSLEPLAAAMAEDPDYRHHEGVFFEIGAESHHLLSATIHSSVRGQGVGGVRFWGYETLGELVRDGLRLSLAMGQKIALAGLWWGGAKGVIARRPPEASGGADHRDPSLRRAVYRDFGRFVSSLRGCYITAEDAGTTPADMAEVFATTRHTNCIPQEAGGSGNPSVLTASGVVIGMEAAIAFRGKGSLEGKTVALQGLGQVGRFMIGELLARGVSRIIGVDTDPPRVAAVRRAYPDAPLELTAVAPEDQGIFATDCDIFAPNAIGAVLDPETIPLLRASIVCGAANNQLAHAQRDGRALTRRGILWAPDFLVNRMGVVNSSIEPYGSFAGDPAVQAHLDRDTPHGIYRRALEVFHCAQASGRSTAEEAESLAASLMRKPHPLWPGRGRQIIRHLVESGWAEGPDPAPEPSSPQT